MPESRPADRTALLTAAEEGRLASTIEAGVLARAALDSGLDAGLVPGPAATEAELRQLVDEGEAARRRFVEANLGLVRMVAHQLAGRSGTSEPDVFQEACLGLLVAVHRFDHRRGFRFATYALFWIRAYAGVATAGALGDLNLPTSRAAQLRSLRGVEARLTQTLGRTATAADIAVAVGRPEKWVAQLFTHAPARPLSSLQLDPAEPADAADRPGSYAPVADRVATLLAQLDGDSRHVLELRLGFRTGTPLGYASVGRRLALPVSRVRRLEVAALERLREICPYDLVGPA